LINKKDDFLNALIFIFLYYKPSLIKKFKLKGKFMNLFDLSNPISISDFKSFTDQEAIAILTSRLKQAQVLGLYKCKKDMDQKVTTLVNRNFFRALAERPFPLPLITCIALEFHNNHFKILLGAGFNLFEIDSSSRTVFHYASLYANIKAITTLSNLIEILFNRAINIERIINVKDKHNQNPLHLVGDKCRGNFIESEKKINTVAKWLIDNGIDLTLESDNEKFNFTPLHKAAASNRDEIVKLILSKNISSNIKNSLGETPLHIAALHGSNKVLCTLLKNNADINAKDNENKTPVMCALMGLASETEAQILIRLGAELNTINKSGHTALYYALDTGKIRAYRELLNRGVSIEREIQNGIPLILAACRQAPWFLIEEIIKKGGNVFQINNLGQSALHLAAVGNTKDVVEGLVKKYNLDVNLKDGKGMTPLHHAVESLSVDKVQILLDLGADPAIRNEDGLNVYDIALDFSRTMPMFPQEIISLLIADQL